MELNDQSKQGHLLRLFFAVSATSYRSPGSLIPRTFSNMVINATMWSTIATNAKYFLASQIVPSIVVALSLDSKLKRSAVEDYDVAKGMAPHLR